MIILGLTGSIATGKSTVARMIGRFQLPVFDADLAVHQMMQASHPVYARIIKAFPKAKGKGQIDRKALGGIVFEDEAKLDELESIIHPEVRKAEIAFIEKAQREGKKAALLDIPLLFESGADALCDLTVLCYCPPFIQKQRAMRRAGMTEEKFARILASQMPQDEKLELADVVIDTGLGKAHSMKQIKRLMKEIGCA